MLVSWISRLLPEHVLTRHGYEPLFAFGSIDGPGHIQVVVIRVKASGFESIIPRVVHSCIYFTFRSKFATRKIFVIKPCKLLCWSLDMTNGVRWGSSIDALFVTRPFVKWVRSIRAQVLLRILEYFPTIQLIGWVGPSQCLPSTTTLDLRGPEDILLASKNLLNYLLAERSSAVFLFGTISDDRHLKWLLVFYSTCNIRDPGFWGYLSPYNYKGTRCNRHLWASCSSYFARSSLSLH